MPRQPSVARTHGRWATGSLHHWNGSAWRSVAGAAVKLGVSWQLEAVAVIPDTHPAQLLAVGWTGQYSAPGNTADSQALIEQWNGSHWVRLKAAAKASKGVELDGVTALSSHDAWAVGINGVIEHWNGVGWSRVRSAGNYHGLDGCDNFDAVSAVSQKDVYAVGYDTAYCRGGNSNYPDYPYAIIEHWNGTSWKYVNPLDSGDFGWNGVFNAVVGVSAKSVWAVGYSTDDNGVNTGTLLQHWNGATWDNVEEDAVPDKKASLWGLALSSSGSLWAIGDDGGRSFVEENDGSSWHTRGAVHPEGKDTLLGLTAIPGTSKLWAVGKFVESLSTAAAQEVSSPLVPDADNYLLTMAGVPGTGQLWAAGYRGGPTSDSALVQKWTGSKWTISPWPLSGITPHAMVALSSSNVWAAAGGSADTAPTFEQWNGTHWKLVPGASVKSVGVNGMSAVSATDIWAVGGDDDYSQPFVERWNGSSWSTVSTPVPTWADGVYFTSVDAMTRADVWAVGYGAAKKGNNYDEPVIEHWNGTRWNIITTPKLSGDAVLSSVSATAADDVWAMGSRPRVTSRSYGLIEHWNGKHWKIVSGPNAVTQLNGVDAISKDDAWAVGVSGSIPQHDSDSGLTFVFPGPPGVILHWDGKQWSEVPSPSPEGGSSFQALGTAGSQVWTVGSYVSISGPEQTLAERFE